MDHRERFHDRNPVLYQMTTTLLLVVLVGVFTRHATAIPITAATDDETLLGGDSNEFPTEETLHIPPKQSDSLYANDFIADLSRCLELRDSSSTAESADCMPGVFAAGKVMSLSSRSNTVFSHVAANSTLRNGTLTFPINVTKGTSLVETNSIRLRLYVEGIEENDNRRQVLQELTTAKKLTPDNNVHLTVSMTGITGREMWKTEERVTVTMEELSGPSGWLDLHLDTGILNTENSTDSIVEVSVSISEVNVSFCDLGIKVMDKRKEPVLLVFGNEQPEMILQGLSNHLSTVFSRLSQRKRRQQEDGSGSFIADPENCRLIKYNLPFTLLGVDVINSGKFEFNYCSGQCIYPLHGNPYYHPQLMALFQLSSIATPSPCCVPIDYKPIGILIKETESNTRTHFIKGLTATECACR